MSVRTLLTLLAFGGTISLDPATAQTDQLLASYPIYFGGGWPEVIESFTHETYLSEEFGALEGEGTLFEDFILVEGEDQIHTLSGDIDPDFPIYAELLTDGLDYWLYDRARFATGSHGRFDLESERLEFADDVEPAIDLFGYTLTELTRTISATLDSPGLDPNGDGIWTDYLITGTFEIWGVPEPGMLGLVGIGSILALSKRRRR